MFSSAGSGGEHTLQRLPRGRLAGVAEARGLRAEKRPAHIDRSELFCLTWTHTSIVFGDFCLLIDRILQRL